MRVLYVSLEGRMAGAEHSLLLLLRHIRGRLEAVVACPAGSELLKRCEEEGVACEELPATGRDGALSKRRCLRAALCLRRVAKRARPDVIHANNYHAMVISSLSRGLRGARLIWHARDLPRRGLLARWCMARAERIIAVSRVIQQRLVALGARAEKIDVVYNGVDPPSEDVPATGTQDSIFTFACVGQTVRWKNQQDFLEAAEIVHRQLPHARFLLVGSDLLGRRDSCESELQGTIASRRMSYVRFTGWQTDMLPIWRQTDCLVHTALTEPFGRVLIEAMGHGRPVVAFASGGPGEIVADGQTGLLAPPGDARALSEAMLRIAREPGLAAAMGRAARRRAREQFSARQTAEGVMSVYRKVLGGAPDGEGGHSEPRARWSSSTPERRQDVRSRAGRTSRIPVSPYLGSRIKRMTELALAVMLLLLALPVGLLIVAAILVADGGPILFAQRRAGLHGEPFTLWKFRTLRPGDQTDVYAAEADLRNRYTRTGGFLRRTRLDELPQLLAVLTGVMSLVGPRPECVEIVRGYGPKERRRLLCRPGVTGLWQVLAPRTQSIHRQMKYDLCYLKRASLRLDLRILARTVLVMLVPGRLEGRGR